MKYALHVGIIFSHLWHAIFTSILGWLTNGLRISNFGHMLDTPLPPPY